MPDLPSTLFVIAVTGGIGCGKSTAGSLFKQMGFEVCDADMVAHDLMLKGSPVYIKLVEAFGADILLENGDISRPALGEIVFEQPEKRLMLNAIVHPAVRRVLSSWMTRQRASRKRAVVEIPLLFESGMDDLGWDAVVCVSSSDELVYRRLASRGINKAGAVERINAQMPLHEKEERSDYVVHNNESLEQFEAALRDMVQHIMVRGK